MHELLGTNSYKKIVVHIQTYLACSGLIRDPKKEFQGGHLTKKGKYLIISR